MDSGQLNARFISHEPSSAGPQAIVAIFEPNGDQHVVRCLVKGDATDLGGDRETLEYLHQRYGARSLLSVSRDAVLGNMG